jgi:hypothetical protein
MAVLRKCAKQMLRDKVAYSAVVTKQGLLVDDYYWYDYDRFLGTVGICDSSWVFNPNGSNARKGTNPEPEQNRNPELGDANQDSANSENTNSGNDGDNSHQ